MKAIVIAGTVSGVGKTTIATGLMGALVKRGLRVQPFKSGPDYIDPSYHTRVTGVPSRNLDTWMLPHDAVLELFNRAAAGKDIAVIEGVMGLYDGHSPTGDEGSTAEVAKLLGAPALLVVDSRKGARSIAAMVGGYRDFDRSLNLAGVILNGIGSEGHFNICREAVEHYTGVPVVGYLPRRDNLSMPERHLGLVPTVEGTVDDEFLDSIVAQCEATLDIPGILKLAEQAKVPEVEPKLFPKKPIPPKVRIAVARDRAFSFYYEDSLDLLAARGAEIVPFSPLEASTLPPDISGLYIGGGFPELFAAELAANESIKEDIKSAAGRGMPVYAECGGLMYLGKSISDLEGNEYTMTGTIPLASQIDSPRLSLGYRTVEALHDGPILRKGEEVRGHEFHWSVLKNGGGNNPAYTVRDKSDERPEGFQDGMLLASYIHLHLGSRPGLAPGLVESCRRYRDRQKQRGDT